MALFGEDSNDVFPTRETLQALLVSDDPRPIIMVNLLKFKEGGRDAWRRYGEAGQNLTRFGASRVTGGRVERAVIGESDWDTVVLIRYPSRKAFAEMLLSEDYQAAAPHRAAALAGAELLMIDAG